MFCTNCGKQISDNAAFCPGCGAQTNVDTTVTATTQNAESVNTGPTEIKINNLENNPNIKKIDELGCFEVYEYQKDLSVNPSSAVAAYFMQEMNYRKRQVLCNLNGNAVKLQAGAMQWQAGNIAMETGLRGAKDFLGKAVKSMATNESIAKPIFRGNGKVMLEPTYKYIFLEDLSNWGSGMVLDDGLFLACDSTVNEEVISRKSFSSAVAGGEGLFNLVLSGSGIAVLESAVPREELIEFELKNDEVRIDGNMAIAWSKSLQFTVEKSTKSLFGSWVSGEGFVNVYRGTGKILMSPVSFGTLMKQKNSPSEPGKTSSGGIIGSVVSSVLDL
ncbi:MAG: AIM24 family protein [Clostridia bacterium]|nr:AIM24 family protein [Clostridia bacterium]